MDAIKRCRNLKEQMGLRYVCSANRRGVLLLVVLSMLTLFLLLGAAYIAVARRARMTSRAFANNITATAAAGVAEKNIVDNAFLVAVRGTKSSGVKLSDGEDLLGDKYGYQITRQGQAESATVRGLIGSTLVTYGANDKPVIGLEISGLQPAPSCAAELNGRVLTFLLPGLNVSTRILQAWDETGSATKRVHIAAGPTLAGESLSFEKIRDAITRDELSAKNTQSHTNVVINGREFSGELGKQTNESYDAPDQYNPLLARTLHEEDRNNNGQLDPEEDLDNDDEFDQGSSKAFIYTSDSQGDVVDVDNDGDGIVDSHFIDVGLAPIVSSGSLVYPKAAMLVVDLDGRINANVHGTDAGMEAYSQESGNSPEMKYGGSSSFKLGKIPRGTGAGPAEISLERSFLFRNDQESSQSESGFLKDSAPLKGGCTTLEASDSARREVPQIGSVLGRYGGYWDGNLYANTVGDILNAGITLEKPGVKNVNDVISRPLDLWRGHLNQQSPYQAFDYFIEPGRYASPSDWKGSLRFWVDPNNGEPVFYKPKWDGDDSGDMQTRTLNPLIDDPYEVNLTPTGPRCFPDDRTVVDNLYSAMELEGLLRYYDSDSMKLSRRLVALCGTNAATNRLLLTTESWDTPAITGTAWQRVICEPFKDYLSHPDNRYRERAFSPETFQGLRFDINRPFHDQDTDEPNGDEGLKRRQEYAKQLFCLLVAVVRKQKNIANSDDLDVTTTRQLAQFAINVVDFRDADSVMTPFDYMSPEDLDNDGTAEKGFNPTNTAWQPNARVWGCERPELLITETHAWHDRRTDDLSVDQTLGETSPDNDLDQSRRPVGAFFVELMAPQASQAKEYDGGVDGGVTDVEGPVNPSKSARAEPIPKELVNSSGDNRFETTGTIDIHKLSSDGDCPVWRIVSVRGDVDGGTAFDDTNGAATMAILDPSAERATAIVDRVFYFATPPASLKNPGNGKDGTPGSIFWATDPPSVQPAREKYVVVGTNGPQFDFRKPLLTVNDNDYSNDNDVTLRYTNQVHLRFDSSSPFRPATLSEPTLKVNSTDDPYGKIAQTQVSGFATGNQSPYVNSYTLTSAIDQPFDSWTSHSGVLSDPFIKEIDDQKRPMLMMNGTHSNFSVVHLQRLANPNKSHDALTNPYLTVDSMTVDLTVVNTVDGDRQLSLDEHGTNGTDPQWGWLKDKQQPFRYKSVERGGKKDDGDDLDINDPNKKDPGDVTDIWNRRVRSDINGLDFDEEDSDTWASQNAYRSKDLRSTRSAVMTAQEPAVQSLTWATFRVDKTSENSSARPAMLGSGNNVRYPWLAFYNRPFVCAAELSLVPTTSSMDLCARHTTQGGAEDNRTPIFYHLPRFLDTPQAGSVWESLVSSENIFSFICTPSPYPGMRRTVPNASTTAKDSLRALGWDLFPIEQFSDFREPGRVNINTMPAWNIWRAVQGNVILSASDDGKIKADPDAASVNQPDESRDWPDADSATNGMQPFEDTFSALASSVGVDSFTDSYRMSDQDAVFRTQTINRLNNSLTVRSDVYAVWVTIGYFNNNGVELPKKRNRGFYIFDRSIPVAYEQGQDHNVRDAILLRRIIQ